jgi:hypothetical protein
MGGSEVGMTHIVAQDRSRMKLQLLLVLVVEGQQKGRKAVVQEVEKGAVLAEVKVGAKVEVKVEGMEVVMEVVD